MNDQTPSSAERTAKARRPRLLAQARRGRPLHPGQGQLCRRHQAAGHAVRRLRPLALWPCPHQVHQQGCRDLAARRVKAVLTAEDLKAAEPALHADACRRRAGGAGSTRRCCSRTRKSPSSIADRPLRRGRRASSWSRSNMKNSRPWSIRSRPWPMTRPIAARGHQGQDGRRPRPAQASQSHLLLGGRATRQAADKAGNLDAECDGRGKNHLSARSPLSARDLRLRCLDGQDQRQAHGLGHLPGAACRAHGRLADLHHSGAQYPHHLARHRRRIRQQGRGLSRLHLRHRRLDRDRACRSSGSRTGSRTCPPRPLPAITT